MDIAIKVKVEGLEPITEAITNLAAAISLASNANVAGATAAIEKAKGSKSKAAAQTADTAVSAPQITSEKAADTDPKSAAFAVGNQTTSQPVEESAPSSTTESQGATSSTASSEEADPKSAASAESAGNASTTRETAAPSTESSDAQNQKTISDEELRSLAGKAAAKDKEKTKALINKYATAVSLVPAEHRPVLVKELEAV